MGPEPREHDRMAGAANTEQLLAFQMRKDMAKKAMKVLTPAQKNSLELAFFGDLTHQQITESLGEPLGTVKSSIRGAMIRLKNELEGMWP